MSIPGERIPARHCYAHDVVRLPSGRLGWFATRMWDSGMMRFTDATGDEVRVAENAEVEYVCSVMDLLQAKERDLYGEEKEHKP